ncbi:thioredoxin, partial [Dietzia sp. SLG510A3-30A2]|nr:thioredoxin [Dietzia sp. SLG510A3-30A2]
VAAPAPAPVPLPTPQELQQQAETAVADAEKAVHEFAGQVDAAAKSLFAPLAPPAPPQG